MIKIKLSILLIIFLDKKKGKRVIIMTCFICLIHTCSGTFALTRVIATRTWRMIKSDNVKGAVKIRS